MILNNPVYFKYFENAFKIFEWILIIVFGQTVLDI